MAVVGNKLWLNLNAVTGNLELTQDPGGVINKELIPKADIAGIFPVKRNVKPAPPEDQYWIYPYPAMTIIEILFRGERRPALRIELQSIVNQPTWSTGLQTGMNQAIADLGAFV